MLQGTPQRLTAIIQFSYLDVWLKDAARLLDVSLPLPHYIPLVILILEGHFGNCSTPVGLVDP